MLSAIPVWSADNSAKKAGVLEFNVTPDPIVMFPSHDRGCLVAESDYLGTTLGVMKIIT